MHIALISDVHANLPALEAVIEHAEGQKCSSFWNLGDLVGYGPFPEETISRLCKLPGKTIVGNYDLKVLAFPKKKGRWKNTKQAQKYLAFKWAYANLSPSSRRFLRDLPATLKVHKKKNKFLLTHGSPASNEEAILTDTPEARLKTLGKMASVRVILCGHTHEPLVIKFKKWWFVNPGSVGRPGDGDPRASYAVLHIKSDRWDIQHFRVDYDVSRTVREIQNKGLPEEFEQVFKQGAVSTI